MTDLTAIKTPFGLLDRETQEALKAHGGPYECFSSPGQWDPWAPSYGTFFDAITYRVKPAPPKPREWWAVGHVMKDTEAKAQAFLDELNAQHPDMDFGNVFRVREVLPE